MNTRLRGRLFLCLLGLCAALVDSRALAQNDDTPPDEYRVEIIVIRNLNPVSGTEIWPVPPIEAEEQVEAQRFTMLEPEALELDAMVRQLSNSRNFRPVSHFGWVQPGFPQTDAKRKIVLRTAGTSESVSGYFLLSKERYLRLEIELSISFNDQTYHLSAARRLLSRQVHYFDHPYFGVIAKVTPL